MAGSVGVAFAASRSPWAAVEACAGAAGLVIILRSPALAVCVLVASFYFTNYLNKGVGLLTPDKALGGLALLAWTIQWLTGRRRLVTVPSFGPSWAWPCGWQLPPPRPGPCRPPSWPACATSPSSGSLS